MYSAIRSSIGIALVSLVFVGAGAQPGAAQTLRIESAYPRQLPPGQTTVIHVAISSRDVIQAADQTLSHVERPQFELRSRADGCRHLCEAVSQRLVDDRLQGTLASFLDAGQECRDIIIQGECRSHAP